MVQYAGMYAGMRAGADMVRAIDLLQANFSSQRYRKLPKQVMEGAQVAHRAQR
jgi:hypothetical protein